MKIVSPQVMRQLDEQTIQAGIRGRELMARAGSGLAGALRDWARYAELAAPEVLVAAGKGNNGGDAFVAARKLFEEGWSVQVLLAAKRNEVKGDAADAMQAMIASGLDLTECPGEENWAAGAQEGVSVNLVVDALLGTGASGPPAGAVAAAICRINQLQSRAWVVSVDVPSGLNGDTGQVEEPCVRADLTLTMGLPKRGLLTEPALEVRGGLELVDIGLDAASVDAAEAMDGVEWNAPLELARMIPKRPRCSHKGNFGRVLVIGGSRGMPGAPAMAALGALHAGAGLITVLTPSEIAGQVSSRAPELMVAGGPANDEGGLSVEVWQEWRSRIKGFDALVIGPGMGGHPDVSALLRQILREGEAPMVLDADALNALKGQLHWLDRTPAPIAITPHPGEMARLFGLPVDQIQSDRVGMATEAAKRADATVVLKGADTVIAPSEGPVFINTSGNPGMASGGTGDVLAGMLGGLAAQGLSFLEASRLAVYLHGKAGDIAALRHSQMAMTASSLLDALPAAVRTLQLR
jgi:NAD(P)H-hydrate epimerase